MKLGFWPSWHLQLRAVLSYKPWHLYPETIPEAEEHDEGNQEEDQEEEEGCLKKAPRSANPKPEETSKDAHFKTCMCIYKYRYMYVCYRHNCKYVRITISLSTHTQICIYAYAMDPKLWLLQHAATPNGVPRRMDHEPGVLVGRPDYAEVSSELGAPTQTRVDISIYIYMYILLFIYINMCTYIYMCIHALYVNINYSTYVHVYAPRQIQFWGKPGRLMGSGRHLRNESA